MVMLGTQLCDLRLVAFPLLIHSSRMKIITLCIGPCSYLGSSQLVVKTCISKHYDIKCPQGTQFTGWISERTEGDFSEEALHQQDDDT